MITRIKRTNIKNGSLIPLGNNFAYVLGYHPNKTDDVDIGNKLSVDDGELMQFTNNGVKVYSAQPILKGGISPAQYILSGGNPRLAFAAQEKYKDINHLKDDGSKAKFGLFRKRKPKYNISLDSDIEEYPNLITPAIISASPSTKKGIYLMYKKLRKKVKDTDDKNYRYENYAQFLEDEARKTVAEQNIITDPDTFINLDNYLLNLSSTSTPYLFKQEKLSKRAYKDSLHNSNNIIDQIYRYIRRRRKNNEDAIQFNQTGADIIDLRNNAIRLTPTSKQSTALFNEFVENKYPSVRKAKDYKDNSNLIIGDLKQFPASDVNYYGGIENGIFKIQELKNFADTTTVIPARNIKKDIDKIYGLSIPFESTNAKNEYLGKLQAILDNNSTRHNPRSYQDVAPSLGYDYNKLKNYALNLTKDAILQSEQLYNNSNRDELLNAYNLPYSARNALFYGKVHNKPFYKIINDLVENNEDLINDFVVDYNRYGTENSFLYYPKDIVKVHQDYQHKHKDFFDAIKKIYDARWDEQSIFHKKVPFSRPANNKENPTSYLYYDKEGKSHPISEYNASVLDGKTILGNNNGSIFIGKLQDMSKTQLDSLNNYLKDNPSLLMRTDLGSFDQYRLDNPSLSSYLKQYFEHPNQNDKNVYVVGTKAPNKIWNDKLGGKINLQLGGSWTEKHNNKYPINQNYAVIPLQGNPKFDITGETKYADIKPKSSDNRKLVLDALWAMENPYEQGLNRDGTYSPYGDPNGADQDVGPGILLSNLPSKEKYTKQELEDYAYSKILEGRNKIRESFDAKYGEGEYDKLDETRKYILDDVRYRRGNVSQSKWPNLYQAIRDNDTINILTNARTKFKNEKGEVIGWDNDRVRRLAEKLYPDVVVEHKGNKSDYLKVYKKK